MRKASPRSLIGASPWLVRPPVGVQPKASVKEGWTQPAAAGRGSAGMGRKARLQSLDGGQAMSTTVDACLARLHRAGWSVGDVRLLTASGPLWLVTGTRGKHFIRAERRTQTESWQNACELAAAVGLLREDG